MSEGEHTERVPPLKDQNVIRCAAIKINDVVCFVERPGRHHSIMWTLGRDNGMPGPIGCKDRGHIQGFLDYEGSFLSREEALKKIRDAGFTGETISKSMLCSEDMW